MSEPPTPPVAPPPRKNRGWIWYFVVVLVLTVTAVVVFIVFNLSQQLTAEQLDTATRKWEENGPKSYELYYVVKRSGGASPDHYKVRVNKGVPVSVTLNDLPLDAEHG